MSPMHVSEDTCNFLISTQTTIEIIQMERIRDKSQLMARPAEQILKKNNHNDSDEKGCKFISTDHRMAGSPKDYGESA